MATTKTASKKKTTTTSKSTKKKSSGPKTNRTYNTLENEIDGSIRLFGVPHQFTDVTDPRIGTRSNLGRAFAERLIMEAPMVCIKPGKPHFLPGMSDKDKKAFINGIVDASSNNTIKSYFNSLKHLETETDDVIPYYSIKDCYDEMMAKVNVMCKMMAVFLGIGDTQVPWTNSGVTFAKYDWRYYSFKSTYNDTRFKVKGGEGSAITLLKDAMAAASSAVMSDTQWLRFYVDSSSSFGESASNSTTTSMLESYTEKLEGIAKEVDTIAGLTGKDVGELAEKGMTSMDNYIQKFAGKDDSAFGTLLKRISGSGKQVISGGNFLIPEIWSDSDYNKSYSFTINLSTPYGCPESWYLNIGVPLMHILGMCLPQQLSANTYKSPYLVKCYSKGWFNCNYGIIDSISIEKGGSDAWSIGGLPTEIKVSLSVKDLYSTLSIPVEPYSDGATFLSTGMLEYLMVNCGIDITHQNMFERLDIWSTILSNNFTDRFTAKPFQISNYFKNKLQDLFNIL